MTSSAPIVDLYAGPGGWDEGMRSAGITDVIGLEIEADACATAEAAGHRRARGTDGKGVDVSAVQIADYTGAQGLVASPPCQAWSMAGKRRGEQDRAKVHALIDAYAAGSDDRGDGWADERSHHAAQPVRWVRDLRPEWVCFEQVPPVLGLWQHAAEVLRRWGYSTWTGVLNAADYGVPQTRERAVLMARLGSPVQPPTPTHAEHPEGTDLFGGELLPWVSMADALGWPIDIEVVSNYGTGGDSKNRGRRAANEPSATLTSKADRMKVELRAGSRGKSTSRELSEPAPTILCSRLGNLEWVLDRRTNSKAAGGGMAPTPTVAVSRPALTSQVGAQWVRTRPATTVAGDPRISAPGHRDRAGGERQHADSIHVSIEEAAILQSFPADYPWHGNKGARFLQVGNAFPPKLAESIAWAVAA